MQTIYTTSYRLGMREKIVDLNAYRRQLEQSMEADEEEIEVEIVVEEPAKKYCVGCGAEVSGKFCSNCGAAQE